MSRPQFLLSIIACTLLSACLPASDPLVAGRADNVLLRFSAVEIAPPMKATGQ